jgi:hypothetical protein
MASPQITVQGGIYDHHNVDIAIGPINTLWKSFVKDIEWTGNMDGAANVNAGQVISVGSTNGIFKGSGSMTLVKEGWDILRSSLPDGYTKLRLPWTISCINEQAPVPSVTILQGVRITGHSTSSSSGGKEIDVKLTLLIEGNILENGKSMAGII